MVRPSHRSHSKQPSSAKVALILTLILTLSIRQYKKVWRREDSQTWIQVNGGEIVLLPE